MSVLKLSSIDAVALQWRSLASWEVGQGRIRLSYHTRNHRAAIKGGVAGPNERKKEPEPLTLLTVRGKV